MMVFYVRYRRHRKNEETGAEEIERVSTILLKDIHPLVWASLPPSRHHEKTGWEESVISWQEVIAAGATQD